MKVLIISAFPPETAPEANHALHISEHLADAGLSVHVLCKKESIAPTRPGMVVHAVMDGWDWRDAPRLMAVLRDSRPDVVLLLYIGWVFQHQPMITYLPTFCAKVLPGVPCVTQFENVDKGAPMRSLVARVRRKARQWQAGRGAHWLFGTLLRHSTRIIALSTPHRANLLAHDADIDDKTVILPPPPLIRTCADTPAIARQRSRVALGIRPDDFVWIYWGYIYPGKGIDTLLQAMRIAARTDGGMRLVLAGGLLEFPTGPISCSDYYRMVRRLPETLGIADRVIWTGHFDWDSDDGSRYLHAADACVLPFDYGVTLNNSSLAAATTHGLPVLSTELPLARDDMLEHGRNVYLCPAREPEQLAEAMTLIGDSAELRGRLRTGAQQLAREWHNWDTMTDRLIAILESAVAARTKPRHVADLARWVNEAEPAASNPVPARAGEERAMAQSPPRVSVVVAVHNVGTYLCQCLDALAYQTLEDVEIIVVNDASTDHSAAIIDDYCARFPQIRAIHCTRNHGLATVRNIGMRAARGQYVAFADGDDWVDTRMCEMMYRRAEADGADVVIADATVLYDDVKSFGKFFDQHIRKALHPRLRTMPFDVQSEPRVLLLEPVAWTKLYRRSFLEQHALRFEDGMNSYEDMCFHFAVLLNARRISLLDEALAFYRQNRPGQISGRTSRKVFEVFDVFRRIQETLVTVEASPEIWGLFVKVQLRQFDWLLKDRVRAAHKREFMARIAKQLASIPQPGFQSFAGQASAEELTRLFCMRRKWLWAYHHLAYRQRPLVPRLYAVLRDPRPAVLKRSVRRGVGWLRRRVVAACRTVASKAINLQAFERQWQTVNDRLIQLGGAKTFVSEGQEPLTQVCEIGDQTLLISYPSCWSGLSDALWRMEHDHYLTQTAVFRPGDTVVDVGAHVGVLSLYLAKKHPSVRVYAIEPDPVNFACLEQNILLNGLTNVIAINKAVCGDVRGGKRALYVDVWSNAWATLDRHVALSRRRTLRIASVATTTLEQVFQEHEIRHARLLKITAPGVVGEALRALPRTGCVDLLCGELELEDCSRTQLETASWAIARHHFWRLAPRSGGSAAHTRLHRLPEAIESAMPRTPASTSPALVADDHESVPLSVVSGLALMQTLPAASPSMESGA